MTEKNVAKKPDNTVGFPIDLEADAGRGYENVEHDDMVVPFLRIAQALSPEVDETAPEHINGIKQGMLYNTATKQIWEGGKGIGFVPAVFKRQYLEFIPRDKGGGFQGEHGPEIMDQTQRGENNADVLMNGNEILIAGTWFGILYDMENKVPVGQVVVSMVKTQLKYSRQLMTRLRNIQLDGKNGRFNPPLFWNLLSIKTMPEKNDFGRWFSFDVEPTGSILDMPMGEQVYLEAKKLADLVNTGQKRADTHQAVDEEVPF